MIEQFKNKIRRIKLAIKTGEKFLNDKYFINTESIIKNEVAKEIVRTDIINYFISLTSGEEYLEIGVKNPKKNFDHINCAKKYSVDPGIEFKENPVDYKMTSDVFFEKLKRNELLGLDNTVKFDVIFIDGLHLADQVEIDIKNSLNFIKEDGFIVLHDCNPPTEFHQREDYYFRNSPARGYWNGTTWKAYYKFRHHSELYSICFDTDWGVAVLSKKKLPLFNSIEGPIANPYYEYLNLDKNRQQFLNLTDFNDWKKNIKE